jgi:hypothetical protein
MTEMAARENWHQLNKNFRKTKHQQKTKGKNNGHTWSVKDDKTTAKTIAGSLARNQITVTYRQQEIDPHGSTYVGRLHVDSTKEELAHYLRGTT